jgi:hypothetical protein
MGTGGGLSSLGGGVAALNSAFFLGGGGAGFFLPITAAAAAAAAPGPATTWFPTLARSVMPNRWPRPAAGAATAAPLLPCGSAAGGAAAADPPIPRPGTEMPAAPSRDTAPWLSSPSGAPMRRSAGAAACTGELLPDRGGSRGGSAGPGPLLLVGRNPAAAVYAGGGGSVAGLPVVVAVGGRSVSAAATGDRPSAPSLRPGGRGRFAVDRPVVSSFQLAPASRAGGAGAASTTPGSCGGAPAPAPRDGGAGFTPGLVVGSSDSYWLRVVSRFGGGPNEYGSRSSLIGRATWFSLWEFFSPRPISPFFEKRARS